MAADVTFDVDFGEGGADWSPWEGTAVDFVPFEGTIPAIVKAIAPGRGKESGNPLIAVTLVTQKVKHDDEQGYTLIDRVLCGGEDTKGGKLVRQLFEFLHSTGTEKEKINRLGRDGKKLSIGAVTKEVVGRVCYIQIRGREYEGRATTDVTNYRTKKQFEDAVAVGSYRTPAPKHLLALAGQVVGGGSAGNSKPEGNTVSEEASSSVL